MIIKKVLIYSLVGGCIGFIVKKYYELKKKWREEYGEDEDEEALAEGGSSYINK